jgi:outer membrane receptor protein involved in Fe transport
MSKHDNFQQIFLLTGCFISRLLIIFILSGLNIQLYSQEKEQTFEIDSVVIRARQESRNLMEKPYTEPNSLVPVISKISRLDIRRQGSANIIDALNYIPGGLTETRGRQVKQFFSVRGQKYPYPDYAIDGVWQKEFEELPYFFSTSDIEEIEIVRSSAALLTGLSGLAGLINIKTREYTSPETNLEMEYGSYNNIHSHLSNGNKTGNFSYSAGIGYDKNDGPEGKHAKEEMFNFSSQLKWQPTEKLSVKGNIFFLDGNRELRIAEEPADKRYQAMIQNFDPIKALLTNLKFIYRPGEKLSSELQLFYTNRNPTFNDEVKMTSSNEKDSEWGLNFIQSVSLSGLNILRFGGLYNHWVAPNGKRFYTGKRCDTETFSGVVVDEQRIGRLTLDAGLRITGVYVNDYGAFNIEGDGASFKNVTPVRDEWQEPLFQGSIGASWRINNNFSVYFNSTAGQIKPRPGSMTTDFKEPENEERYKLDLGIENRFAGTGKVTLTAFGVIQNDAIVLSGETYTDTLTNITRELYLNRDQNQWGLEFEIFSPEIYGFIKPFLNFTLMKSMFAESEVMITNKENPVFISSGGLYVEKKKFDFNIFAKYVSSFENDRFANPSDGPQPLGDYFTLDVNSGYTTKGRIPARFYLRVRNLTDTRYSTVIGYPDFGRMFFAGLQIKFPAKPV